MEDVLDQVVEEARRRERHADADLTPVVDHLAETLPAVVADLGLAVDGWFGHSVLPTLSVRLPDGTRGVLKVRLPGELDREARVMRAGPAAYAAVLSYDPDRGVLITEHLGERLVTVHPDLASQVVVVAPLLRHAWHVPRAVGGPAEQKAEGLQRILGDLGERFGSAHPAALARAIGLAGELGRDETAEVVCHGDPHAGNVLARRDQWAFVDADGFGGEAAYDVGVVLRDASGELLEAEIARSGAADAVLREACDELSRLTRVDAGRAWAWAGVERVTTGLYLHWFGEHEEAERFLAVADVLSS